MKRRAPQFSDGPTAERGRHDALAKDVLTPKGAPEVARHRVRTILTPIPVRLAILEEVAGKPEVVRERALRRRLTVLDRALSDLEAARLDQIVCAIVGLSNVRCLDYVDGEVRTPFNGRLPFGERRRRQIEAAAYVLKHLPPIKRAAVLQMAALLDPSAKTAPFKPQGSFIEAVKAAAKDVAALYDVWHKTR